VSDHEYDTLIDGIASELKRPVRFSESFDARVMSAIRTAHLSVVRGETAHAAPRRRRLFIPAFAALAAAAALTIMVVRTSGVSNTPAIVEANVPLTRVANLGEERVMLQDIVLTVFLPGAKKVAVMGAFNDWDATRSPMVRGADGTWTVKLRLLPGSYEYQFLADGSTRMTDPTAPATDSEFGEANSVLTVTPRMVP
jgi:hypothetical protein